MEPIIDEPSWVTEELAPFKNNTIILSRIKRKKMSEDFVVNALNQSLKNLDLSKKSSVEYLSFLVRNKYSEVIALTALSFLLEHQSSFSKELQLTPRGLRLLVHSGCYESVDIIVQNKLVKHKDVSKNDLRYLAQFGHTLEIALRAALVLTERLDQPLQDLRIIYTRKNKFPLVRKFVESYLLEHSDVSQKDIRLADYRKKKGINN